MKYHQFKYLFYGCLVSLAFASAAFANSYPFVLYFPSSDQLKSKVEPGWTLSGRLGSLLAHGKTRNHLLGVGPWARGWVIKGPEVDAGVMYGFNKQVAFGVQIPISLLSANINTHVTLNEFFGYGVKLGMLSSIYSTSSFFPTSNSFISFSPSFQLVRFGFPEDVEINDSEMLGPLQIETISQSRFVVQGQLAFGLHYDPFNIPLDIALLTSYGYAPGNGILNSFLYDDTFTKHFLRTVIALKIAL